MSAQVGAALSVFSIAVVVAITLLLVLAVRKLFEGTSPQPSRSRNLTSAKPGSSRRDVPRELAMTRTSSNDHVATMRALRELPRLAAALSGGGVSCLRP